MRTFDLQHADAELVAENIEELFSGSGPRYVRYYYGYSRGGESDRTKVTATADPRLNAVTVVASETKMEQIANQIAEWDRPFIGDEAEPRIFNLKYTDPEKIKELLENLFTKKEKQQRSWWWDDWEEETSPVGRLHGQFMFEAYPETGKLVVVTKSSENYAIIERMIEDLDQPQLAGRPRIIQLKFANAENLAEQLNALLNAPGTPASILRQGRTGTFDGFDEFVSPYNKEASARQQQDGNQGADQGEGGRGTIGFWWQENPTEIKVKQPSNLIGKLRIVPNVEQNSLLVAAPEEYVEAIEEFIHELDKPGHQVLIKAVIAEITHDDTTSLGFRFSSDPSVFSTGEDSMITENALRGLLNYSFEDQYGQSHSLSLNVDVNNIINLLGRITDLTIRSEPKILTADNIEGEFFDGQDIPFIENSNVRELSTVQSFTYFPVGIRLKVRPHITKDRNVDLTVSLIVSSFVPGRTLLGGAIVDRRQTTTRVVLEDGKTFMISGILQQEEREIIRRIPGLGDIPGLGEVFKHREIAKVNTELVIFLTPHVIEVAGPERSTDPIEKDPKERLEHAFPEEIIGEIMGPDPNVIGAATDPSDSPADDGITDASTIHRPGR